MQIAIGKKILYINLFNKNIIRKGDIDQILFSKVFHLWTDKSYKSIFPYIYVKFPGKTPKCFGKQHTWGDQFHDLEPSRNEEAKVVHVENELLSLSYCKGTAMRIYNDGREEEIDVWCIIDSKMKHNGKPLAANQFPMLDKRKQITDPLDTGTILTELSMGLSQELNAIKEKE